MIIRKEGVLVVSDAMALVGHRVGNWAEVLDASYPL
jgi:hypothetical protein